LSVPHPAVNRPTTLSISDLGPAASPSTFPSTQAPSLSTHDALHIDPLPIPFTVPVQAHFHEHDNPICSSAHHHDNSSAQDASSLAPDPPFTQLLASITSSSNPNGPFCLNIPSSSPLVMVTESLHSSPALQSSSSQNSHPMITRTRDNTRRIKDFPDFLAHHISTNTDPISFSQANKCSQWQDAMAAEITALADNNTWNLVPQPTDQKVIGCKWVYKTKRNADGTINHFKARLVAKRYNQEYGVDYEETYSPVIRSTTIRVILSLAVSSNWSIQQLDVSNAFLNGQLSEKVFMEQPQGFVDTTFPHYVCLLNKFLYGLKQAPKAWFEKLSTTLLQMNFRSSSYDPSLFISQHNNQILLVLVYVDDILITGNNSISIQCCINHLKD
jgi:Reverse transcriptase (RNA-dependent DNA polymerase)